MQNVYSNLPLSTSQSDSSDPTKKYFDQFYTNPLELDHNSTLVVQAFFEKRGFSPDSAETIALIIVSQTKIENFNVSVIMDTLTGLDDVALNGLVAEILNYNRFSTSTLGIYRTTNVADEVQRNILA
jgi:hypothetical protein